jgi:hypothetical protein
VKRSRDVCFQNSKLPVGSIRAGALLETASITTQKSVIISQQIKTLISSRRKIHRSASSAVC